MELPISKPDNKPPASAFLINLLNGSYTIVINKEEIEDPLFQSSGRIEETRH